MKFTDHCPELGTQHNGADGWAWQLRASSLIPVTQAAEIKASTAEPGQLHALLVSHQPYHLKISPPDTRVARAAAGFHRRYGGIGERYSAMAECVNTLQCERRFVQVSKLIGFGQQLSGSQVINQALLFKGDGASRTLTDALARAADEVAAVKLLERAGTLIESMFRAGFAQLNLSSDTIRLGVTGPEHDHLTDLELVESVAPRQQEVIALLFATLFREQCAQLTPVAAFDQFAEHQMAMCLGEERTSAWLDACYRYFKVRELPRSRRRRISRSGIGLLRRYWIRSWARRHR